MDLAGPKPFRVGRFSRSAYFVYDELFRLLFAPVLMKDIYRLSAPTLLSSAAAVAIIFPSWKEKIRYKQGKHHK
jgi:hypothetical protein